MRHDPRRPGQLRIGDLASACDAAVKAIEAGKAELHDFAPYEAIDAVHIRATVLLEQRGYMGFVRFIPEPHRGIRRKTTLEMTDPLDYWARPFKFNKRPDNIGTLEKAADDLVMMINRLLHEGTPDDVSEHIADLIKSAHVLETSAELGQLNKVVEALGEAILRAANWQEQLLTASRTIKQKLQRSVAEAEETAELQMTDEEALAAMMADSTFAAEVAAEEARAYA